MQDDMTSYNRLYFDQLKSLGSASLVHASTIFGVNADVIRAVMNTTEDQFNTLIQSDCLLATPIITIEMLESCLNSEPQVPCEAPHEFTQHIPNLNYYYLLLIMHLSHRDMAECVLRTKVQKEIAQVIMAMPFSTIQHIASNSTVLFSRCSLTLNSLNAITSAPQAITPFMPIITSHGVTYANHS